jgi:hypothetical protein
MGGRSIAPLGEPQQVAHSDWVQQYHSGPEDRGSLHNFGLVPRLTQTPPCRKEVDE